MPVHPHKARPVLACLRPTTPRSAGSATFDMKCQSQSQAQSYNTGEATMGEIGRAIIGLVILYLLLRLTSC
jgi:hypothetical protein